MKSLIDKLIKKYFVADGHDICKIKGSKIYFEKDVKEAVNDYKLYLYERNLKNSNHNELKKSCKEIREYLLNKYKIDKFDYLIEQLVFNKIFGDFEK